MKLKLTIAPPFCSRLRVVSGLRPERRHTFGCVGQGRGAEMKPYVICHMNASVDGRILGSRWRPAENRMAGLFERLHEQLGGGSWLIGRVTGSEYARADSYPDRTDQTYPREAWFARRDAAAPGIAWGIALDAQGKI